MSVNIKRINSPLQIHMQPNLWSEDQRIIHDQNMRMPRDPDGMPLLTAFPLTQDQIQRIDTFGHSGHTVHFPPPHHSQHSPYLHSMQVVDFPVSKMEMMSMEPSIPSKRYSSFFQDSLRETSRPRLENKDTNTLNKTSFDYILSPTYQDMLGNDRQILQDKLKLSLQQKNISPSDHSMLTQDTLQNKLRPINQRFQNIELPRFQQMLAISKDTSRENTNNSDEITNTDHSYKASYFHDDFVEQVKQNLRTLLSKTDDPQRIIQLKILNLDINNNNYIWLKEFKFPIQPFDLLEPQTILEFLSKYSLSLTEEQIKSLYDFLHVEIRTKAVTFQTAEQNNVFRIREMRRLKKLWNTVFDIKI